VSTSGAGAPCVDMVPRPQTVDSCPVCDSNRRRFWAEGSEWLYGMPGRFPVVRCIDCGLGYLAERPTPEDLGTYYPEGEYYAYRKRRAHSLFWRTDVVSAAWYLLKKSVLAHHHGYKHLGGHRALAAMLRLAPIPTLYRQATFKLDVLLHPFVDNGALLEVGCGAGDYLDLMRALGWKRVVGVDLSPSAVTQARDGLGLEAYCGELASVGLETSSFDAVSLSHTLEHIGDPRSLLHEIRRVLKPGGRLAIAVPNIEALSSRVFKRCWVGLDVPRHLLDFSLPSLRHLLERAGFVIEAIHTSPGGGYEVALFSHSRHSGDPRVVYTDSEHRFSIVRRARAFTMAVIEAFGCALGRPLGEEVMVAARNPR
jgi:SAM-dependent methyltransferase